MDFNNSITTLKDDLNKGIKTNNIEINKLTKYDSQYNSSFDCSTCYIINDFISVFAYNNKKFIFVYTNSIKINKTIYLEVEYESLQFKTV